jgi:DNA topoisomerase-2
MHTANFDVVVGHSQSGAFQQVSFVNGISTTKGGTHVDKITKLICDEIAKDKRCVTLKPAQIKSALFVFVRAVVINPTFSSQTKAECTSKITDEIDFKPKFIKDILATGVIEDLVALGLAKVEKELKKTDGSKKSRITGVPKLDDANWAGTHRSQECTLIITEGDSAKALAIAGLSVVGRNQFGVFPLRGKPRNVRDATIKQVTDNEEFSNLKKILGLQHGKKYSSLRELRYGRLMIMTDADLDGSHIKGLVLNMFHVYWPELIQLGFVVSMVTPVIKAGKQWFFTEDAFREAAPSGPIKYYKGLGTSTSAEAKE